jgi:hypothetical protein
MAGIVAVRSTQGTAAQHLFLSQCLVHQQQQTLHVREVWLEVPRFPQVQRCGG